MAQKKLVGMSDIRRYFHRNDTPIYFISAFEVPEVTVR